MSDKFITRNKQLRRSAKRAQATPRDGDIMIWKNGDWEPSSILMEITRLMTTSDIGRINELETKLNKLLEDMYI